MSRPSLRPNRLETAHLRGDLLGGLTAGIVALPLALGFGVASGMEDGAAAGLYGAIAVGFFAALFGGTPSQVSGPTGPMTVVVAALLAMDAATGRPDLPVAFLPVAIVIAGLLQIVFGFAGLGGLIRFVPTPVISGFMTGIGVIVILLQLQPLLGHPSSGDPVEVMRALPAAASAPNMQALLLGLGSLALVYLSPKVLRKVPGTLVALLVGTAATALLHLDVPLIGDIPSGLPALQLELPGLTYLHEILAAGLTLAVLGSIDSLLTSVVADNLSRTRHRSNQELVGQGLGNAVAGLFGGLPGAGATMRTVVNYRSGGRTPLSGMVHSLVLLGVLLGLGPLASRIPLAVLAGILLTVGIGILDYRGLRDLARAPRSDSAVLLLVLGMTVFVDLMQAVGVGVVLACLMFVKNLGDLEAGRYVSFENLDDPWPDEAGLSDRFRQRVFVYHADGPFFFGSTRDFLTTIEGGGDHVDAVIIRMKRVPFIDQSGAYALEDLMEGMRARNVPVLISGLRPEPRDLLVRMGVIGRALPESLVFEKFDDAVLYLQENLEELRG